MQHFHSYPGSRWNRWDPHIHAPGTVLNDQFQGPDSWKTYLDSLESATPTIRAIGATDYYVTDTYERLLAEKAAGRLPACDLIFPNIEMRLSVGTIKARWVNEHLLVSPEERDHLAELKRFLALLRFKAHEDTYTCCRDDLIKLGRRTDPKLVEPIAALRRGCEQFKVSLDDLRGAYGENAWAKNNILVAVAGSESDGTSGIRAGADETLRREVEGFAHIIFSSSPAQRAFWVGQGVLSEAMICERYKSLKPCMHGSDAHDHDAVGAPDGKRYTWIKGQLAFDTLRQACIDPAGRAFVGEEPPAHATSSQVISNVTIQDASWAETPHLPLNPGLVAIIGARGSGKTALADIIASGCDATPDPPGPASFLDRAHELLKGSSVLLNWQNGERRERMLDGSDEWSAAEYPRARYLSQKFVEELCSATGIADELLREIERVIFESHMLADRDGTTDFDELHDLRTIRFREARAREEETLADLSDRIGIDLEKNKLVAALEKQVEEKSKQIEGYTRDRAKLVSKGGEARVSRLAALSSAADKVRQYLRFFAAKQQSLLSIQDEVGNLRAFAAPEALRKMSERHQAASLSTSEWQPFLLDYKGDVDAALRAYIADTEKAAASWRGATPTASTVGAPFIRDDADLTKQSLSILEAEIARLEKLINMDRDAASKYAVLSRRVNEESIALTRLRERLADCQGAKARVLAMAKEREDGYARVFDAIVAEEIIRRSLYAPLMTRLNAAEGSMKKLSFSVSREADITRWAAAGEALLDLRQSSSFKGRGTLRQLAETALKGPWETGDPSEVSAAMAKFREDHQAALMEHAPVLKTEQSNYREWSKRFAKWLYGTEHIKINYSIDYDGVDIRKLSPGTRGIVLLLLYLALDTADDRPLIIDQPEENLDPKSIFDELVELFAQAKAKRQVIMVTHNANLVVNADADQIIVASAGPHVPGELPPITYESGGLEDWYIRKSVCDILEGGERAFQERARRLRVKLNR